MRDRRDHRGRPEWPAHHDGARAGTGEERKRRDAAPGGRPPLQSTPPSPSPGPGRRPAHVRVRERRAPRTVRGARKPRPVQVRHRCR